MTGTPSVGPEPQALLRMRECRRLVRQGVSVEAVAKRLGVDPLICFLWSRLPADLWPDLDTPPTPAPPTPAPPRTVTAEPRYATVVGENGVKRIVRLDGHPLATGPVPVVHKAERPLPPLVHRVVRTHRQRQVRGPRQPAPADDLCPSGEEIRERRQALGFSQRELADAAAIPRGVLTDLETGRRSTLNPRFLLGQALERLEDREWQNWTFYEDDLGWCAGFEGRGFVAGQTLDYCLAVLQRMQGLRECERAVEQLRADEDLTPSRQLNRNNTSGVCGVGYRPDLSQKRPWQAQIMVDRRVRYLGLYATKEEAIEARRLAEREVA